MHKVLTAKWYKLKSSEEVILNCLPWLDFLSLWDSAKYSKSVNSVLLGTSQDALFQRPILIFGTQWTKALYWIITNQISYAACQHPQMWLCSASEEEIRWYQQCVKSLKMIVLKYKYYYCDGVHVSHMLLLCPDRF